ncbi:lipid-A-disaccharide synthase [Myxacorys almedinensis]|uniref:Lipid-A-disaccharide synthase n=1 Tax=Myxacorys almedinensis A TaxID=2690445 RepID=A0A8J7Z579_9CYAN|nr:lipid-A-disaccharide synthase [Myxacorys almedinensis]NDJ15735.1 lipid-A-disaccharide synthase [Myxacorys almedinensis A]
MKRRIFISTGEVSGDLQGALLVEALHRQAHKLGIDLEILALGGDRMADAGATLLGNTSAIGSVGIFEALPYILPTLVLQRRAKRYLRQNPPDAVVMIDYMTPNISIGQYVRRHLPQVPTAYFIAPQEWVWSHTPANTQKIVEVSDQLLAIFPEEARYYAEHGAAVSFVGHPLLDRIHTAPDRAAARSALGISDDQVAIALLPASRPQEVTYLLPVMFQAAQIIQSHVPQAHFWIPLSLEKYRRAIEQAIAHYNLPATVLESNRGTSTLSAIAAADLALTKSGTVNLELALLNVPQVVMYRVNPLTAWLAKHVVKFSIPFMSPPNLVLMDSIVPEFLQDEAVPAAIAAAALELLKPKVREQTIANYQLMRAALGEPVGGNSSGHCVADGSAQKILTLMGV